MRVTYSEVTPKKLLNKGSGFLAGYSHTLNPYAGCAFACSYCYVRQMPIALFRREQWGLWVDMKRQAADALRRELRAAKSQGPVTIFMSSATDPYQPIEHTARVTRSLLEAMLDDPPAFLLVQTRSPLVRRDIDLLARFGSSVRVSMTVETDREDIRKRFTPAAPPIAARLQAMRALSAAGIAVQAAVSPVLPCSDAFAAKLYGVADRVCVDDYFMGDGSGGKRTARLHVRALYEQADVERWYDPEAWRAVYEQLLQVFPQQRVYISRRGFEP